MRGGGGGTANRFRILRSGLPLTAAVLLTGTMVAGCGGGPAASGTRGTALDSAGSGVLVSATPAVPIVAPDVPDDDAVDSSSTPPGSPVPQEPLAFFRSLQAGCRQYARKNHGQQVESARFLSPKLLKPLGGGAFEITDGLGMPLVVKPGERVVLPESGRDTDAMPVPYATGCAPEVFKGNR